MDDALLHYLLYLEIEEKIRKEEEAIDDSILNEGDKDDNPFDFIDELGYDD